MRKNETRWLCEHARSLERYSGQWVMFSVSEGVVSNNGSLQKVLRSARKLTVDKKPFVFHVPSRDELISPHPPVRL